MNLKTDHGNLKIATNQTSYLTQLLFWNGYKSFEYSEIFESLSTKIDTFLDIGSNIGYYALLAVRANPDIRVFAFEPAIGPKYYLNQNIELNQFESQITLVDKALSNINGSIDFYEVQNDKYKYLKHNLAGEGNAGTKTESRNFIKNKVQAITLAEFVVSEKLKKIDLIKIDTEGTEIDILNSGKNVIIEHQPIVICETLFNRIENELDDFFNELDYLCYANIDKRLKKIQTIKRITDNGVRNCFFVPKSKESLIREYISN